MAYPEFGELYLNCVADWEYKEYSEVVQSPIADAFNTGFRTFANPDVRRRLGSKLVSRRPHIGSKIKPLNPKQSVPPAPCPCPCPVRPAPPGPCPRPLPCAALPSQSQLPHPASLTVLSSSGRHSNLQPNTNPSQLWFVLKCDHLMMQSCEGKQRARKPP